jgi:hypothetical protein
LLSGVAVTALQDMIDDFCSDIISKNKQGSCRIKIAVYGSKNFGALNAAGYVALARPTWRLVRSGGGLFCIPY